MMTFLESSLGCCMSKRDLSPFDESKSNEQSIEQSNEQSIEQLKERQTDQTSHDEDSVMDQSHDPRIKYSSSEATCENSTRQRDQTLSFIQMCRTSIIATDSCCKLLMSHPTTTLKPYKLKVTVNKKVVIPFPILVYDLVSNANANCIQWTNHGSSFTIFTKNEKRVNSTLRRCMLPKLTSFIRTLYFYGWKQSQHSKRFERTYYHPLFHKCANQSDIASITKISMNRQKVSSSSRKVKPILSKPIVSPSPCSSTITSKATTNAADTATSSLPSTIRHEEVSSTKVTMSPISIDYAPSRKHNDVLFSPIETTCDLFQDLCNEEINDNNDTDNDGVVVVVDNKKKEGRNDNPLCKSYAFNNIMKEKKKPFIDVTYNYGSGDDDDGQSELSVPMTPLSINYQSDISLYHHNNNPMMSRFICWDENWDKENFFM